MIQSILFFLLGFLCAGFLALMIAPAIWRRAVVLTRRRIEASVPLTANEIRAEKDRQRAEYAMMARRLEMDLKAEREKIAGQSLELARRREQISEQSTAREQDRKEIAAREADAEALRAQLAEAETRHESLASELALVQSAIEQKSAEIGQLEKVLDETSFMSSSRQIELIARESEVEKLVADVMELRDQRRELQRKQREATTESKAARDELAQERRKATDLETRLERMLSTLTDREEKLGRREKEIARLRERLKAPAKTPGEGEEPADVEVAAPQGGVEQALLVKLEGDRDRLEKRLLALTRENKRLSQELAQERHAPALSDEEREQNELLREEINTLAAKVVEMTAALEGPGSPIHAALSQPGRGDVSAPANIVSLAERVKELHAKPQPADAKPA